MADKKPKRLARRVIYENPWVNLYVDRVEFPGGRIIEQHHILDFEKESVAAVVQNAAGHLLMIQAYRYTTDTIEWEVPAGVIEMGEGVLAAAEREAREETGYRTTGHELVYSYYPINGISDKVFHVVKARAMDEQVGEFDANEVKSVRWMSRDEVRGLIARRELRDGYSLMALLLVMGGV